tara:strand:- start:4693 stop:5463 length:771 start_codon:yes stop_codon:yes gene_type:complete
MNTAEKIHPFEKSGMGIGPFEFVGSILLPSPALAEHNPSAYNAALDMAHKEASNYGVVLGSCYHCGMGLMHHCIIEDSKGKTFIVGNVCVQKTADQYLGEKTKIAARKMAATVREQNKQIKHEIWLASPSEENPELSNEQLAEVKRQEREDRYQKEAQLARERFVITYLKACETWGFFFDKVWGTSDLEELEKFLDNAYQGFLVSVTRQMMRGDKISWKQWDICSDIYAKTAGRSNSKAYSVAYDDFSHKVSHLRD